MEKLQAAIQKARQSRVGGTTGTGKRMAAANAPVAKPQAETELWEALQPLKTDRRHLEAHRVVTSVAGEKATPFDILRTKVLLQMRQNGWKRLAITSPLPSCGKTTVACNLALGLGRQSNLRSILFDFDLRDPSVHEFFGTRPPHSIGEVLGGSVDFGAQAMRVGTNVAFSMAQYPETDPTRLLLSDDTAQVLDEVEASYKPDIMIFDLPSVLVNDDTRAFLKNADCALIVVRASMTRYGQFDACEREIAEHTNVIGTVLNAYRLTDPNQTAD